MYLKKSKSYSGKTFLSFVQGYRDKDGKSKQKTIQKLGYLEDLKKEYDNPIEYFQNQAREKNAEDIDELVIKNLKSKKIEPGNNKINYGYKILQKIYNEIGLKELLSNCQSDFNVDYSLNDILEFLIYSRIINPSSKKSTYEKKEVFLENYNFLLHDVYRSLDNFYDMKSKICKTIWENTKEPYKRDVSTTYYDCTNYYFEIPYNDEDKFDENGKLIKKGQKKKGPSKEKRKTPIIGMGLLMDKTGFPLTYDLFPGNESEKDKLLPSFRKYKSEFNIERTIIVADRGLNTSDNTFYIAHKNDDDRVNHDGYVYGQSIAGATKAFKDWAINPEGYIIDKINDADYTENIDDQTNDKIFFKHKSRIISKDIKLKQYSSKENPDNKKREFKYVTANIYQKQMVYFSNKYAKRQKKLREETIKKAEDLIKNPGNYTKSTSYGAAKYINNIAYVKKTGEIPDGLDLSIKKDLIKEEEKYDGYYSIVTSEKNLSDLEIRNIYKGLWKIEETFKITKTNLETRPVFVWDDNHVEGHFLTCFVSLVILRLLESKLNNKYSINKIIESLQNMESVHLEYDIYVNSYINDLITDLEQILSLNLSQKYTKLSELKKI